MSPYETLLRCLHNNSNRDVHRRVARAFQWWEKSYRLLIVGVQANHAIRIAVHVHRVLAERLRRSHRHAVAYPLALPSNRAECNARERVDVVRLVVRVQDAVVISVGERRPGGHNRAPIRRENRLGVRALRVGRGIGHGKDERPELFVRSVVLHPLEKAIGENSVCRAESEQGRGSRRLGSRHEIRLFVFRLRSRVFHGSFIVHCAWIPGRCDEAVMVTDPEVATSLLVRQAMSHHRLSNGVDDAKRRPSRACDEKSHALDGALSKALRGERREHAGERRAPRSLYVVVEDEMVVAIPLQQKVGVIRGEILKLHERSGIPIQDGGHHFVDELDVRVARDALLSQSKVQRIL
mmetsp:Transcript_6360/g.16516  ORF Transcript_6360/g.16516 Transcript_6360/m.16516 type:complete len:351 (-) Transcript_6360:1042-2094(-)